MRIFCIILIMLFSLVRESVAQTLGNGLLACYPFSGNANDMSGNGHNGTAYGPILAPDRFNNPNSAYRYDGVNDYIDLGLFSTFTNSPSFSISVWIQPDTVKLQTILMVMPDNFYDRFNAMAYYNHNGSSSTIWDFGNCTAGGRLMQTGTIFSASWQHWVYVIDPNTGMKVYKDGVLNLSQATSSSFVNRNRNLWIGGGWDAANALFYFGGRIDDMRLYDRELTPSEVQQLFILESYCMPTGIAQSPANSPPVRITSSPGKIRVQATPGDLVLYGSDGHILYTRKNIRASEQFEIPTESWASQVVMYAFRGIELAVSGKLFLLK